MSRGSRCAHRQTAGRRFDQRCGLGCVLTRTRGQHVKCAAQSSSSCAAAEMDQAVGCGGGDINELGYAVALPSVAQEAEGGSGARATR